MIIRLLDLKLINKKRRLTHLLFLLFILIFPVSAVELDSLSKYKPVIEGTIRAKYEYNTSLDASRFQVRNARFSINGNFSSITSYKAEIDLSDEGVTKMLDAYIRLQPVDWVRFTLGQQKIPFSTDNLRSPHQLYFANRSFIGKQLSSGLRDVGATVMLSGKKGIPFDFQVGAYNGNGLYNQQEWKKEMDYAFRLEIFPVKNMEISLNYNSIKPENLRMNLYDAGVFFNLSDLHLDIEYIYKTYTKNTFQATQALSVFGAYDIKTSRRFLSKITPLIRYDVMTDNNKGFLADNTYKVDDIARSRLTSGLTFSLGKAFLNDIRLNYEHYFFKKTVVNNENKLVVEFVVRF